jgi:hypothetical protein
MKTTKSALIREIAHKHGSSHSTQWFVDKCRFFGVEVTPQHVHAVMGRYRDRSTMERKSITDAARMLLVACDGDLGMCHRVLKVVA